MTPAARLRQLLSSDELLTVPGCSDALGAHLVERAGFDAVYMTGFGTSATLLGQPDVGLLSAGEMTENAARIASATTLPVIADGDTGYGNAMNVMRTVEQYERAGVAAIQLEDQVSPKRCGHMAGKEVVSAGEMVAKVRAAADARNEMLIIARTDARAPEGFGAALDRARAYVDAGADVLFVEALESEDEFARVGAAELGVPLVYNWVEGGRSPSLTAERVRELGYSVLLLPVSLLLAAAQAMEDTLAHLRSAGVPDVAALGSEPFDRFNEMIGLPEFLAEQTRYGD